MNKNDEKDLLTKANSSIDKNNQVENNRRKLMTKLAAGAFAVPTVLATLSRTAAANSIG